MKCAWIVLVMFVNSHRLYPFTIGSLSHTPATAVHMHAQTLPRNAEVLCVTQFYYFFWHIKSLLSAFFVFSLVFIFSGSIIMLVL